MSESLTQVLADTRGELQLLRRSAPTVTIEYVEDLVAKVAGAAEPFMTWLAEPDAALYSGHAVPWLRSRFATWERDGLARWSVRGKRERQYLQIILPRRVDLDGVKADARREAAHG